VAHDPASSVWTWTAPPPTSFYSAGLGGAQRQPNGNTLVCGGVTGRALEVDAVSEDVIWEYINPVGTSGPVEQGETPNGNRFFRFVRYPPDFAGFAGKNLRPGFPIEGPFDIPAISSAPARGLLAAGFLIGAGWACGRVRRTARAR
jgi:hypothetical protein